MERAERAHSTTSRQGPTKQGSEHHWAAPAALRQTPAAAHLGITQLQRIPQTVLILGTTLAGFKLINTEKIITFPTKPYALQRKNRVAALSAFNF